MSSAGSVTHWLARLKVGDPAAAQPLWAKYFQELVERARHQLGRIPRRAADEEDVVLSAFHSFCRAAAHGRFPQLDDRHDLWQLLVVLTERKAIDLVHRERRAKRGGGRVLDEGALTAGADSDAGTPLGRVEGPAPDPAFVALVADECRRLLDRLKDAELRAVALWKMEGYTIAEIAAKLGCVPRTVDRRLRLIRTTWEEEIAHE